jgi:hypothetical protein
MKTTNQKIRVIVGWNNPKYNSKGLGDGFESDGYKVIRVAADKVEPELSGQFDYHLLEEYIGMLPFPTPLKPNPDRPGYNYISKEQKKATMLATTPSISFPMRYLLQKIEREHGCIYDVIICQCDLILDMAHVQQKWYYYFTEGYKPTLPINGIPEGVFYGYVGGNETLLRSFPYDFHRWKFCELVPYGMDKVAIPPVLPAWEIRNIDIGFKGLIHFSQHSMDQTLRGIYDERRY